MIEVNIKKPGKKVKIEKNGTIFDALSLLDSEAAKKAIAQLNNFLSDSMGNWETILTMLGGYKMRDKFSFIVNQVIWLSAYLSLRPCNMHVVLKTSPTASSLIIRILKCMGS